MTQAKDDPIAQALGYMHHQAAKGFEDLLALMDRTAGDWLRALEGITEAQANFKPGEEWCLKELLGHVLHSNRGVNQQIAEMGEVESPKPSEKVRAMGELSAEMVQLSIDELRREVAAAFEENKTMVKSLERSNKLEQTFPHPLFGQLNLKEWIAFQRVHAMDHIQQLDQIKADPGYPSA
jgi:hypothetical protein